MSWRTLRVACVGAVFAALAAQACGGSSSSPGTEAGGSGGRGGSSGSAGKASSGAAGKPPVESKACGTATCEAVVIPIPGNQFTIPACCADKATSTCGLDSSVLGAFGPTFPADQACQARDQPGERDKSCPSSTPTPVMGSPIPVQFPGCCRPDNTCGYDLATILNLVPIGLGCVDSAPFLNGAAPKSCGDIGAGGEGGASQGGSAGAEESGFAGESSAGAAGG